MPEVGGHDSKSSNLCHAVTRLQTGFLDVILVFTSSYVSMSNVTENLSISRTMFY